MIGPFSWPSWWSGSTHEHAFSLSQFLSHLCDIISFYSRLALSLFPLISFRGRRRWLGWWGDERAVPARRRLSCSEPSILLQIAAVSFLWASQSWVVVSHSERLKPGLCLRARCVAVEWWAVTAESMPIRSLLAAQQQWVWRNQADTWLHLLWDRWMEADIHQQMMQNGFSLVLGLWSTFNLFYQFVAELCSWLAVFSFSFVVIYQQRRCLCLFCFQLTTNQPLHLQTTSAPPLCLVLVLVLVLIESGSGLDCPWMSRFHTSTGEHVDLWVESEQSHFRNHGDITEGRVQSAERIWLSTWSFFFISSSSVSSWVLCHLQSWGVL